MTRIKTNKLNKHISVKNQLAQNKLKKKKSRKISTQYTDLKLGNLNK